MGQIVAPERLMRLVVHLVLAPTVVMGSINTSAVLIDFYHAAAGHQWINSSGWGQSSGYCSWFGVTCDSAGQLNSMYIHHATSAIHKTCCECSYLFNNSLSGTLSTEVGQLTNLREL